MREKIVKTFENDDGVLHEEFSELLKNHAGYVLITCQHPKQSESMKVEMSYGGSLALVHLLLEDAQGFIDQEDEEADSVPEVIPFSN